MSGTVPSRPPISLTSPSTFSRSVCARFIALWTPSFVRSILYGQALSVALTFVSVLTTELVDRNWVLPSTQVFFSYAFLFIVYTPYTVYKYGLKGWCKLLVHDGWKYLILTLGDFEAGYLYIKAFAYTDLMSCMLLDAYVSGKSSQSTPDSHLVAQMDYTRVHVRLLGSDARPVPLDTNLGGGHLHWRSGAARDIRPVDW